MDEMDFLLEAVMDDDDILEHHGIKGQKWGIRRWQYENGSLTPEGEVRYLVNDGKTSSSDKKATDKRQTYEMTGEEMRAAIKRANLERRYTNAKNMPSRATKILNVGAAAAKTTGNALSFKGQLSGTSGVNMKTAGENVSKIGKASGQLIETPGKLKKYDLSAFSDEELEKLVKRAELEKTYTNSVKDRDFNESIQTVNNVLSGVGSALTIATASVALYQMLKKVPV